MSPHKLHMMHLRRRAACLLRKGLHALEVRRARSALSHHSDQMLQLAEFQRAATQARIWHARQAAIATAHLRSLGALPSPLQDQAAANDQSRIQKNCADSSEAGQDGASSWATPRVGAVLCIASAGIVAAALWHSVS